MSTNPPPWPGPGGVGKRIEDAMEQIETEMRHVADYVNAEVIPQVRTESIAALRNMAVSLRSFADKLEHSQAATPPPANNSTDSKS